MFVAFADRRGVIEIVEESNEPDGMIVFARCDSETDLSLRVETVARHPYADGPFLVPGVPEADDDKAAVDALIAWRDWAFADCTLQVDGARLLKGGA